MEEVVCGVRFVVEEECAVSVDDADVIAFGSHVGRVFRLSERDVDLFCVSDKFQCVAHLISFFEGHGVHRKEFWTFAGVFEGSEESVERHSFVRHVCCAVGSDSLSVESYAQVLHRFSRLEFCASEFRAVCGEAFRVGFLLSECKDLVGSFRQFSVGEVYAEVLAL